MITNILEYLEQTVAWLPGKRAFWNEETSVTFGQLHQDARAIGSYLLRRGIRREPVAVLMPRRPRSIGAFLGAVYAGDYYVPLDETLPKRRLMELLEKISPRVIICDEDTCHLLNGSPFVSARVNYKDAAQETLCEAALAMVRARQVDTDPVYVVFASGSAGAPKGVMGCHRGVIGYIEHLGSLLRCDSNTVFGCHTPFYSDACLKEMMCTMKYGASTCLISKEKLMFPVQLVKYLNAEGVNTLCWQPSALSMISSLGTFEKIRPEHVHTVTFSGEVFPTAQLNLWQSALPKARFLNLYGPTEATGVCCYYEVTRRLNPGEQIPIGRPFPNASILLLGENGQDVPPGTAGEICIRGSCLTLGYFRDPESTDAVFVQNPRNPDFPEKIYRTGDLGRYNHRGELEFLGRTDGEVKLQGHRVQLEDVEKIAGACEGVQTVCCLLSAGSGRLHLYYTGECAPRDLILNMKQQIPRYMLPHGCFRLKVMPMTPSGKIDKGQISVIMAKKEAQTAS